MTNPQTPETGTPEVSAIPEDFNEFEKWRANGNKETPSDDSAAVVLEESETGADSETADETTDKDTDDKLVEGAKKKGGFKKRISKLTGRIADLERQLAGTGPAVKSGESATSEAQPAAAAKAVDVDAYTVPKPLLKDFASVEEYTDKLTDWKLEKKDHERTAAERAKQVVNEQKQLVETWQTRTTAAKERFGDYDKTLAAVEDIKLSAELQRLFLDSEVGPELAYTLAKDRGELARIAALSPIAAAKALGKIEATLAKSGAPDPKPPTKKVTSAPKPISPVSGGKAASSTSNVYDADLANDYNAWEKARNAQLKR